MRYLTRPACGIAFALFLSVHAPLRAGPGDSAKSLDAILRGHGVKGAAFAGKVINLTSGATVYEFDADRPMTPASNAKLIVMAAAIDRLGGDFQFETILALRGKDLVIIGGGDPAFGDPKLAKARGLTITSVFREWAAALRQKGITRIEGRLLFDDSIFDAQHVHPQWPADQHLGWYEAPIGGLNFNDNCVTVNAKPSKPGSPAKLSMTPGNTAMPLVNRTRSGGKGTASVTRSRGNDDVVVSGSVSRAGAIAEITVADPGLFFATALRTTLAAEGIRIDGPTVRSRVRGSDGKVPAECRVIARHRTPLADVLNRAGKNSLGMMAEGLCKMLGARGGAAGSWSNGTAAVEAFVRQCGASPGQCELVDGSGLARENRLSPSATVAVLARMFKHPGRERLMQNLSHCGTDGTLEKRMRDIPGRVIGKTGYIAGVRTLAGYVKAENGEWFAFAFYYNNAKATAPLSRAQDAACRWLAKGGADFDTTAKPAAPVGKKSKR